MMVYVNITSQHPVSMLASSSSVLFNQCYWLVINVCLYRCVESSTSSLCHLKLNYFLFVTLSAGGAGCAPWQHGRSAVLQWWGGSHDHPGQVGVQTGQVEVQTGVHLMCVCVYMYRYLDNVVNKQTVAPPIPHLHALLTSGDDPPPEIDIFDLIKSSYEVRLTQWHVSV